MPSWNLARRRLIQLQPLTYERLSSRRQTAASCCLPMICHFRLITAASQSSPVGKSTFNIAVSPTSFEFTAARLVQGSFAAVIVVIYRPGSHAVRALFFDEFAAIMDCVATHQERVFVVGDVNIRSTWWGKARQFFDLIASYGFCVQPSGTTHKSGGTIDVVLTQLDYVSTGQVLVTDVELFDHHLLSWSVPIVRVTSSTEKSLAGRGRNLMLKLYVRQSLARRCGSTSCGLTTRMLWLSYLTHKWTISLINWYHLNK